MRFRPIYIAASAFAVACLSALPAQSQPSGSVVVFGAAAVSAPNANTTLINQASSRAIINWQDFSIAAGSSVVFNQPGASAIALNRVVGSGASQIFGNLQANGHVWIINSNGVLFGQGSQINVGGLLATTSDIADSDFAAGRYDFNKPSQNPAASVDNSGTIHTAPGGSVVLSGAHVGNSGLIQADAGRIVLGGADAFTVDFDGDNLLRYQITTPVSNTPVDAEGTPRKEIVSNSGTLAAAGGTILMTARAAANVADNVVNNTGMISATSATVRNGEVILDAGDGTVEDSGTIAATGNGAGQTGGNVTLAGTTVNVADNARIDASGDQGGGTVAVGGGLHGGGAYSPARNTTVGRAVILANANTRGNGGTISIWSSGATSFAGSASARGGSLSGNGGTIETSGHTLGISSDASVDTSAPAGTAGDWLLDPTILDIVSILPQTDPDITNGIIAYGDPRTTVFASTVVAALANGNVTLQAKDDINVQAAIVATSGNTLELDAGRSIVLTAGITVTGGTLILSANNPAALRSDPGTALILGPGVLSANSIQLVMGAGGGGIGSAGASIQIASGNVSVTTGGANAYVQATSAVTGLTLGTSDLGSGSLFADSPGALTFAAGSTSAGSVTATAAGNITLASGAAITASSDGNAIVLSDGGVFDNLAGAAPFSLTGGGRWLVYSQNPDTDVLGPLTYDFRQYNTPYPIAPTPANGNGFLYTAAPTIALSLKGGVSKTYDGTSDAVLTADNFSAGGAIGGDTVTVINIPTGSYDTPNAGINKTVTVSGLSTSNLSAMNGSVTVYGYQLDSGTVSGNIGTITAATLTYNANAANRTYGAANPALSGTVTGFVHGESLEIATSGTAIFTTPAIDTSNVGLYPITGTGLTANNGNYVFVQAAGNDTALTINPAILTVTPNAASTVYSGVSLDNTAFSDNAANYSITGFQNSQTIASAGVTLSGSMAFNGDTTTAVRNVGTYTQGIGSLTLSSTNNNYVMQFGNQPPNNYAITAATLTYTATAANRTYGAANPALSGTVTGFVGSDNLGNATSGTAIFTTTADALSNVGSYAITGTGLTANNGNYVFAQAAGNATAFTINPAILTVTPNAVSTVYNGMTLDNAAYSDNTANYTISGFQNSQTIASAGVILSGSMAFNGDTATAVRNVAAYTQAAGSLTLTSTNNNYAMAFSNPVPNNYVIAAATLTYTADAANRTYGAANPVFSGTISGFVGTDNLANATSGSAVFSSPATATSNVGTYAIIGSGVTANNGNYVFVQAAGNATALTINPATLTVTPNAVSTVYDGAALNNTAYSDNTANYSITGFQNSESIASAGVTLSGSMAFNGLTTTSVRNVGTYTQDAGTLALGSAHNNYVMSFANPVPNNYAITAATLTYTASAANRTYGAANPALSGTVSGFVGSDTLGNSTTGSAIFTTAATSASNVGHYAINGSGLTANNGNYIFAQAAGNATALTINPATLTYVANPADRAFGAANPAFSGTVIGFVNGEGIDVLTGTMTFTSAATAASVPGFYAINGSGLSAKNGNYSFDQAAANATALTINPPANGSLSLLLPWLFGGFGDRPTDADSLLFAFATSDASVDDFVVVAGQGSPQLPGADGGTNRGPIASLTVDGNGYLEPPTSADQLSGSLSHYFQNGSFFDGNYSSWGNEALWF